MKRTIFWCCCLLLCSASSLAAMTPGKLSLKLQSELSVAPHGKALPVIVTLADQVDVEAFALDGKPVARMNKAERRDYRGALLQRLKQNAASSQAGLLELLHQMGAGPVKSFWHVNSLALTASPELLALLEDQPDVAVIDYDQPVYKTVVPLVDSDDEAVEDNLVQIKVPQLWGKGVTGVGTTVAIIDSGVDLDHPELVGRWRGGSNSWYNAIAANCDNDHLVSCATDCDSKTDVPCDYIDPYLVAHGTGVAGLMVGGNAGGKTIGVAPGAQWIAAKIFDDQDRTSSSILLDALDWVLDPDGNPETDDAPDVVNASWGYNPGACISLLRSSVQALRANGIAFVTSAGNGGPNSNTSVSPANYPESFAVGSVGTYNSNTKVSDFSGRGPAACTGKEIYPDVVAPGYAIKTTDLSDGGAATYVSLSGTSFSSPVAAGVIALLRGNGGFPGASLDVLYQALGDAAVDFDSSGPDASHGYGLIDAYASYQLLLPPAAALVVPANGAMGLTGDVTLGWDLPPDHFAAAVLSEVWLDTNPDFSSAIVVDRTRTAVGSESKVLLGMLGGVGLLLFPLTGNWRRRWLLLLLLVSFGCYSCGGGAGGTESLPVAETPAAETPAAETPAAETPAAETPAAETPVAETPVAETPVAETPVAETPVAQEPQPEPEVTQTVTGLSGGTTYYWKVVTQTDRGGPVSESAVFHFTTAP